MHPRRTAATFERAFPPRACAHQLALFPERFPGRAASTNAIVAPQPAISPAAIDASVAGIRFSWSGESALAGSP